MDGARPFNWTGSLELAEERCEERGMLAGREPRAGRRAGANELLVVVEGIVGSNGGAQGGRVTAVPAERGQERVDVASGYRWSPGHPCRA